MTSYVRMHSDEYDSIGFHIANEYISQSLRQKFLIFLYQTSMNNKYHTRYNLNLQVIWKFTCIILTITILSNPHITNCYRPPPLWMRSFAPFYSRPSSMESLHFASYHRTERWYTSPQSYSINWMWIEHPIWSIITPASFLYFIFLHYLHHTPHLSQLWFPWPCTIHSFNICNVIEL